MKHKSILAVLDASAIYAFIKDEPGSVAIRDVLEYSVATTYNIAEVVNKMVLKKQSTHSEAWLLLESMISHPYSVDLELAELATGLSEVIDIKFGVSLGDKFCLALGKLLDVPVYTSDRVWKQFEKQIGVEIILIR